MNECFPSDLKSWCAISCPVSAVRFDGRTLGFLDSDRDGHIRTCEVTAAVEFLKTKGFGVETLAASAKDESLLKRLDEVVSAIADLSKLEPGEDDRKALADWESRFADPVISVLGEDTASADAALAAVEKTVDAFFSPPEDLPLVTEEPDAVLPLGGNINPRYAEAIGEFSEKCARRILASDVKTVSRGDWKRIKAAFKPYRDHVAAKPVMNASAVDKLVEEEKLIRYRLYLGEFLENFVTMKRLYDGSGAIFQTGTLRIDGREMSLCFHVDNEAAHSALAGKSECCVIYLKLSRPAEKLQRTICAVVTAGRVASLYVGRNGVFYDRDGKDWQAVVTKVVENQVSLAEAFWAPWKKLGESVSAMVRKFLGDKQSAGEKKLSADKLAGRNADASAAMASSVAAIGIGIGMVGAAAASIMAAVSSMSAGQIAAGLVALVLAVSLPSVVLTYFKLRRRDLGAVLNASGWAVNGKLLFSMKLARRFTKCAKKSLLWPVVLSAVLLAGIISIVVWRCSSCKSCTDACPAAEFQKQEVKSDAQTGK